MLDAIKNRRSVRFMKKEPISDEILNDIIDAGFQAPSGHNNKGWHVYYTTEDNKLEEISRMHKWAKFAKNAGAVVCVCYDVSEMENFWVEDSSAFMENMLIQATDYGLGSCWIGVRGIETDGVKAEDTVRKVFGVDPEYKILSLCIIGKTAKTFNFTKEINTEERKHRVR